METEPLLMTQKQVAEKLGLSISTVRNMVKDGVLRPVKIYKRAMFSTDAVRRLVEEQSSASPRQLPPQQ